LTTWCKKKRKKELLLMMVCVGEFSDCRSGDGVGRHCRCCFLEGEIGVSECEREKGGFFSYLYGIRMIELS